MDRNKYEKYLQQSVTCSHPNERTNNRMTILIITDNETVKHQVKSVNSLSKQYYYIMSDTETEEWRVGRVWMSSDCYG